MEPESVAPRPDRICPFCGSASPPTSRHCQSCGAPLPDTPAAAAVGRGATGLRLGGGCLLAASAFFALPALVGLAVAWTATRTREATATVTARDWQTMVRIDTLGPVGREDWCEAMPPGRQAWQRETRARPPVPPGTEYCFDRPVDSGEGTPRTERVCRPVEPTDDALWCRWIDTAWSPGPDRIRRGGADEPRGWPLVASTPTQRIRASQALTLLHLRLDDSSQVLCPVPDEDSARYRIGTRWRLPVRRLMDVPVCDRLVPAP